MSPAAALEDGTALAAFEGNAKPLQVAMKMATRPKKIMPVFFEPILARRAETRLVFSVGGGGKVYRQCVKCKCKMRQVAKMCLA